MNPFTEARMRLHDMIDLMCTRAQRVIHSNKNTLCHSAGQRWRWEKVRQLKGATK